MTNKYILCPSPILAGPAHILPISFCENFQRTEKKKIKRKKRNKAILTTAVGLLPELITLLNK